MTIRFWTQLGATVAALAVASPLFAQANHFLLEESTIDAAKQQQFEQAQRDYCAAVVRGGAPSCTVLSPTTFARHDLYLTMLSFRSFSHYDEGTYTSKGLTPKQAEELGTRRNPTIKSNLESGFQEVLATGASLSPDSPIIQITELDVHPGYEQAIVESLRSSQGGAVGMAVYRSVAGGDTDRFLVMRYLHRFSELDGLATLLPSGSSEDDGSTKLWREGVRSVKVTLMRERPDLSAQKH